MGARQTCALERRESSRPTRQRLSLCRGGGALWPPPTGRPAPPLARFTPTASRRAAAMDVSTRLPVLVLSGSQAETPGPEDVLWDARARPSLRDKGAARSSSRETAPGCSEAARHWAAAATSPAALSLMAGESCDHPGAFRAPPTLQIPRPACAIASAISDHTTSIPPSTRESRPPNASSARSSPEEAVHASAARGRSASIGAISAPAPATMSARNVVPLRNVPVATPGRPLAVAAIPAARFSSSNPDNRMVTTNAETRRRAANASRPSKKTSAPATTSTNPTINSRTAIARHDRAPARSPLGGGPQS
jgi:hypothetical protein